MRRGRVDTSVTLGPVTLPNPIVAASGTFGHGDEVAALCDPARLGAVTAKSVAASQEGIKLLDDAIKARQVAAAGK